MIRTLLVLVSILGLVATTPVLPAVGVTYKLTVQMDRTSYGDGQAMVISGGVSPNPGPDTAVFIQTVNPNGVTVLAGTANVNASTGSYSFSAVTGGSASWISGTYTVNATWGAYGPALNAKTSFMFASTVPEFPTPVLALLAATLITLVASVMVRRVWLG